MVLRSLENEDFRAKRTGSPCKSGHGRAAPPYSASTSDCFVLVGEGKTREGGCKRGGKRGYVSARVVSCFWVAFLVEMAQ